MSGSRLAVIDHDSSFRLRAVAHAWYELLDLSVGVDTFLEEEAAFVLVEGCAFAQIISQRSQHDDPSEARGGVAQFLTR